MNVLAMLLTPRGRWHHGNNLQGRQAILELCDRDERFRLPDADTLKSQLRSNTNGEIIVDGALHVVALESILTTQSRWDLMFKSSLNAMRAEDLDFDYITVGEKVNVPRTSKGSSEISLTEALASYSTDYDSGPSVDQPQATPPESEKCSSGYDEFSDSAIAIIGMACRYPDADSLEEFWNLINAGECVVKGLPKDRFDPAKLNREPKGPYWGGYLRRPDLFDHRFFGISGREAKSMDPQQRVCLQVAYEAMESAGYCGLRSDDFDQNIGCYVGVANDDYDCNVASHSINAFSLPGTLRAFISGRISHHFGWTGPSITIDTACSASAVAIHTACKVS
jgi:hypothetical protein